MDIRTKMARLGLLLWFSAVALFGIMLGGRQAAAQCNYYWENIGQEDYIGCDYPSSSCPGDACELTWCVNCSVQGTAYTCVLQEYCGVYDSCNPCS